MDLKAIIFIGILIYLVTLSYSSPYKQNIFGQQINNKEVNAKLHKRLDMKKSRDDAPTPNRNIMENISQMHISKRMENNYQKLNLHQSWASNRFKKPLQTQTDNTYLSLSKFNSKILKKSNNNGDCVYWTSPEGIRFILNRNKYDGRKSSKDCTRLKRSIFSRPYFSPGTNSDFEELLK